MLYCAYSVNNRVALYCRWLNKAKEVETHRRRGRTTNRKHLLTSAVAEDRTQLRYVQTENGLHRDEQRWNAKRLEEDLGRLLAVVSRIQRHFRQQHRMLYRVHSIRLTSLCRTRPRIRFTKCSRQPSHPQLSYKDKLLLYGERVINLHPS